MDDDNKEISRRLDHLEWEERLTDGFQNMDARVLAELTDKQLAILQAKPHRDPRRSLSLVVRQRDAHGYEPTRTEKHRGTLAVSRRPCASSRSRYGGVRISAGGVRNRSY